MCEKAYFDEVERGLSIEFGDLTQNAGRVLVAGLDVLADALLSDVLSAAGTVIALVASLH